MSNNKKQLYSLNLSEKALENLEKYVPSKEHSDLLSEVVNDYLENIDGQSLERKVKKVVFRLRFFKKFNLWHLTKYGLSSVSMASEKDLNSCLDWFCKYNSIDENQIKNVRNQYKRICQFLDNHGVDPGS